MTGETEEEIAAGELGAEVPGELRGGDTSDRLNALHHRLNTESGPAARALDGISEQEGAPHIHGKAEHSQSGILCNGIHGLMLLMPHTCPSF